MDEALEIKVAVTCPSALPRGQSYGRVRALNAALTIYGHHVAQAADGMEQWQ
jgi:hypothetical protein